MRGSLGTLDNAGHFVLPIHMNGAATNTLTLSGTIAPSGASLSGTYAINNDTFGSSKGTFSAAHVNFGR